MGSPEKPMGKISEAKENIAAVCTWVSGWGECVAAEGQRDDI